MNILDIIKSISDYTLPVILLLIIVLSLIKAGSTDNMFSDFTEGAASGLEALVKILPNLVGLMAAIAILRGSGLLNAIINLISPVTNKLGIPGEILPVALMRPISGSGTLAILTDAYRMYGPDSFIGRCSSIIMGSTETTFYIISVYYGAVGIKNARYTIAAALLADTVCVIVSVIICRWFYS